MLNKKVMCKKIGAKNNYEECAGTFISRTKMHEDLEMITVH